MAHEQVYIPQQEVSLIFKIFDLIFNFGPPCRVLVGGLFDALNSVSFF